jgi:4-hydroxy-tetrahydrodipicolinate synthase
MKKRVFEGAATAIATPFRNQNIDYGQFRLQLEYQIEQGIDAIVVAGTTGEGASLSIGEKQRLIAYAAEVIDGRVPVVAATGSCNITNSCILTEFAGSHGADAVLVITPYYNKGNGKAIDASFYKMAESGGIPLIIYNVPSRTGFDMPCEQIARLAEHPLIYGIKEACGNIDKINELACNLPEDFSIYSGNDSQILPIYSLGGRGVISVCSNIIPEQTVKMCSLCRGGKYSEALELSRKYHMLISLLFAETNPAPLKCAMSELGRDSGELRLPLGDVKESLREKIRSELINLNLLS